MFKGCLIISLILLAGKTLAQDLFSLMSPESPATLIDLEGTFSPERELDNTGKKTHVYNQTIDVSQRVVKGDVNNISVGARYNKLDLTNGDRVDDLYNEQISLNWKHTLPEEKFALMNASFGSASDKPFKNSRDNTIGANIVYKYDSKWFIFGNYSNNRSFLNNVPLPGALYVVETSKTKTLIVGFPVILWMRPLNEKWSFRYIGFLPWSHRFRLYYEDLKIVRPYLGLEQHPQTYFLHDRKERYDRLFWFERKLSTGIEGSIPGGFKYDIGGGYAFDRQFFEARNFTEDKNFLVNLEASWFISLALKYKI